MLGASAYNFTKTLSVGSTGEDVTQLQEFLTTAGLDSGPITGYFGSLTKAGVIAFQKAHGLAQVGIVGPQTRALLNGGVTPTTPETSNSSAPTSSSSTKSTLTASQVQSIIGLLQAFGADQSVIAKVSAVLGKGQ